MAAWNIAHQEIGGNYAMRRKVILDTAMMPDGTFETMALHEDGEELDSRIAHSEQEAMEHFKEFFDKYALPLQKALFSAGMVECGKYTILTMNEFGWPVAQKITFYRVDCSTYAQYADVVEILCKPYRKRDKYRWKLYNHSFAVYDGWKDLPESAYTETTEKSGVTVTRTKWSCFDGDMFAACESALGKPLAVYHNYRTGKTGKIYA